MDSVRHSFKNHIPLKTSLDVLRMKKAGKIVEKLLIELGNIIKPGITTKKIDIFAEKFILLNKGKSSLKGYKGFPGAVCISVNNVAAHGFGTDYVVEDGDVVTVDTTVEVDGWNGDGAWTYIVGEAEPEKRRLIKAAWKAMLAGISCAIPGKTLGDIGYAVNNMTRRYGCKVIKDLAGHGIGRDIHEDPIISNFGKKGVGLPVVPGMVFTIEPIITLGKEKINIHDDGWSIITEDNSLAAQFECTLAIFSLRTEIITMESINLQKYIDFPPVFL